MDAIFPNFIYNLPLSNELHIRKLEGGLASLDACNVSMKLGKNLIKKVDTIAQEKQVLLLKINNQVIEKA